MSAESSWLARLSTATDYRTLQEVFSEMIAQAQSSQQNADMARSIDEAVRRLEQERARDEAELQEIQARYGSFQAENKGVVGWFKRHIPFTETRKKELEHRDEVADQMAEILADNLVIARAQMLKERFLAPAERRLGERSQEWQLRLARGESVEQIAAYAASLKAVDDEIQRSRSFLAELKTDIDAFAKADFKTPEDNRRRDSDLAAARQDLGQLEREVEEEAALLQTGLGKLAALAISELNAADAVFRADNQKSEKLQSSLARIEEARTANVKLQAAVAEVAKLVKELQALPAEVQKHRENLLQIEKNRTNWQLELTKKSALLEDRQRRFEEARREAEQTQQALHTATQFYETYLAEKQAAGNAAEAEMSPVKWKLQEAQEAAAAAQARLKEVTPQFEASRKEMEQAQTENTKLKTQEDETRRQLTALEQKTPTLKRDLASAVEKGQTAFFAAASAVACYLNAARTAGAPAPFRAEELAAGTRGWISEQGLERPFADALLQAEWDFARHLQAVSVLDRVCKWHDTQHQSLTSEAKSLKDRCDATIARRCRELVGAKLADELQKVKR